MVTTSPIRQQVQLCIGKAGLPVGSLVYVRQGRRENCVFAYDEAWLANPARFNVSADLQLVSGHQPHKAASAHDSVFHGAIADTAPDAWGRRVIARDHAKRRKAAPHLPALTELDYLLAVDDFSRVGGLRPPLTSTPSRTRTASPRPGCPSRTVPSPTCRCWWRARRTSGSTTGRRWPC